MKVYSETHSESVVVYVCPEQNVREVQFRTFRV